MENITVSKDIIFMNDARFGRFNRQILFGIIKDVECDFAYNMGIEPYSGTRCFIMYNESNPDIISFGDYRLMRLSVNGNNLLEWVFQFSHEYCHNLINGDFSGKVEGLSWFEETVCEIASIYQVRRIIRQYETSNLEWQNLICRTFFEKSGLYGLYLECYSPSQSFQQYQEEFLPLLSQNRQTSHSHESNRGLYRSLAKIMIPVFETNPHIWKMILHFGNLGKKHDIHQLFQDLISKASSDYKDSVIELYSMFP